MSQWRQRLDLGTVAGANLVSDCSSFANVARFLRRVKTDESGEQV
jgi:hypothetical protein